MSGFFSLPGYRERRLVARGWYRFASLRAPVWLPLGGQRLLRGVVAPVFVLGVASWLSVLTKSLMGEGYASLIFVLGVTLIGAFSGLVSAVAFALLGAMAFNFFVAAPVLSITLSQNTDYAPPVVFSLCAVVSGFLSGRLRDEMARARRSNLVLQGLLAAGQRLIGADSEEAIWAALNTVPGDAPLPLAGVYRLRGTELVPLGESPMLPAWLELARRAAAGEAVMRGNLAARRLGATLEGCGVLVVRLVPEAGINEGFAVALAPMVALALERTWLALRLAEAHAATRTEELKSALLSSISHDLRTPLTTIHASASSLLAFGNQFDPQTWRELLAGIVEEADRLNHLTANLLQMGRLQAGHEGLRATLLPAVEVVREVIARESRHAGHRPISLSAPNGEVMVEADTALFELVIANVLQNAVRYSPDGSTIAVTCRREPAGAADDSAGGKEICVICISDEGIGIPAEAQERVFERFYRVPRLERLPKGSGLGLAIARGFVEAFGGSIAITSPRPEGAGTTVRIRLPLASAQVPA